MSDSDHKVIGPLCEANNFLEAASSARHRAAIWSPEIKTYADALAAEIDRARSFESASRQLSPRPFDEGASRQ